MVGGKVKTYHFVESRKLRIQDIRDILCNDHPSCCGGCILDCICDESILLDNQLGLDVIADFLLKKGIIKEDEE